MANDLAALVVVAVATVVDDEEIPMVEVGVVDQAEDQGEDEEGRPINPILETILIPTTTAILAENRIVSRGRAVVMATVLKETTSRILYRRIMGVEIIMGCPIINIEVQPIRKIPILLGIGCQRIPKRTLEKVLSSSKCGLVSISVTLDNIPLLV